LTGERHAAYGAIAPGVRKEADSLRMSQIITFPSNGILPTHQDAAFFVIERASPAKAAMSVSSTTHKGGYEQVLRRLL